MRSNNCFCHAKSKQAEELRRQGRQHYAESVQWRLVQHPPRGRRWRAIPSARKLYGGVPADGGVEDGAFVEGRDDFVIVTVLTHQ